MKKISQKKVRILHVIPWISTGGVERLREMLIRHSDVQFEHRVFCLRALGSVHETLLGHGVEVRESTDGSVRSFLTHRELLETISAYRPHIIHGAVFEGVRLAVVGGLLGRVPVVVAEETSQATTRSWKGHLFFRTLCGLSDVVVAISPQVRDMLSDVTGVSSEKIRLISNGVEPLEPSNAQSRDAAKSVYGIELGTFVIGTMSRLVDDQNKRVSDIIRAMPALLVQTPNTHLLVCGDGKQRDDLEELVIAMNLGKFVTFAGNVEPSLNGFSAMDVFVHVASHEGFGLAVAEAAFCALPIVTTGVGGIASIVVPDETALIVPVGAPEAIADAVTRLLGDPALRQRLGDAGRARAVERFSAQRYVRDVEAMYRDLLEKKKVRL